MLQFSKQRIYELKYVALLHKLMSVNLFASEIQPSEGTNIPNISNPLVNLPLANSHSTVATSLRVISCKVFHVA